MNSPAQAQKIDISFPNDRAVAELVQLFESCRLPYEQWTHRAHLAVAVLYVQRYPLQDAIAHTRSGIRRYNESRGDFDGYHETITVFYVCMVAAKAIHWQGTVAELVNWLAEQWTMAALLRYYSPERLWSDAARRSWVEPDRLPFDF